MSLILFPYINNNNLASHIYRQLLETLHVKLEFMFVFINSSLIDLAQDPGHRFYPGHRVIRSFGLTPFFFINQNDIILVKKKVNSQRVYNRVFDRVLPSQSAGSPRFLTFFIFS